MHLEPGPDLIWDPVIRLCVNDQIDGGEDSNEARDNREAPSENHQGPAGETQAATHLWSVLHHESLQNVAVNVTCCLSRERARWTVSVYNITFTLLRIVQFTCLAAWNSMSQFTVERKINVTSRFCALLLISWQINFNLSWLVSREGEDHSVTPHHSAWHLWCCYYGD